MDNLVFRKPYEHYKPYLNPVEDYIEQATHYFAAKYNLVYSEAREMTIETLRRFKINNPIVKFKMKNEHEDMVNTEMPLTKYIKDAKEQGDIIAPSFTRYFHPSKRKSIQSIGIKKKIDLRKVHKHKSFEYERTGDTVKFNFHNDTQAFCKIFNNGLSGSYASKSTVLYNPSAHFTLTSMTRSVSGIGNGLSESMIGGNKYFLTPDNVLNYIACVLTHGNIKKVEEICKKYNLHLPTAEEVLDSILKISRYYWKLPRIENYILETLRCLNGYERAAFLYINDLWNIKNYNEEFMRKFIGDLSKPVETGSTDVLKDLDNEIDGVNILAHHIYTMDLKGVEINYKKMLEDKDPIVFKLASTAKNIKEVLINHKDFLDCFFLTDISPINIGYLKDMLRHDIVLSDTDSTCCSYDRWVQWYSGNVDVNSFNIGVSASVMTITTQLIDHHINMFASNINTGPRDKTVLAMKNEFFWPVFVNANVTKHYYATTYIREGNVFSKPKQEIKGVHLIASTVGGDISTKSKEMMDRVTAEIVENGKISIMKYVKEVADIERRLLNDFNNGEAYMFRKDTIKKPDAYKLEEDKSKYINHILWERVFADDYQPAPQPPYVIYTMPLKINNSTEWGTFIDHLKEENHGMYLRLLQFCHDYKKDRISTFRGSKVNIDSKGIPKELIPFIDIKETILQALRAYYYILETIGFYKKPGYLLSEQGY